MFSSSSLKEDAQTAHLFSWLHTSISRFGSLFLIFPLIHLSFLDNWRSSEYQIDTPRNTEPAVPTGGRTLSEFDDDVSPWNTRESMRTSEDVAQLLVSCEIVVKRLQFLEIGGVSNLSTWPTR